MTTYQVSRYDPSTGNFKRVGKQSIRYRTAANRAERMHADNPDDVIEVDKIVDGVFRQTVAKWHAIPTTQL